jgi:formiminoglutamase
LPVFETIRGNSPVILGIPHTGTEVPPAIRDRLDDNGRKLADTDWHVERLVADLHPSVTRVRATTHRYVIDANRDPDGASLYPGQNTTELVPTTDFDGVPIWKDGMEPTLADIAERRALFHRPYHEALSAEIARIREACGIAILVDCHSIRSRIPFLFEGTLPDLNIGTNGGVTCAPSIEATVMDVVRASPYSNVLNGRFKGGWTTRHYGRPQDNVHAVQIEIAQSAYLETESAPFDYAPQKAERLRIVLSTIVRDLERLAFDLASRG